MANVLQNAGLLPSFENEPIASATTFDFGYVSAAPQKTSELTTSSCN